MYNHIKLNMEDQLILFKELLTLKTDIILTDHSGNLNININNQDLKEDSKLFNIISYMYQKTPFDKNKSYTEIANVIEDIYFRTSVLSALDNSKNNKKPKPINEFTIIFRLLTHNPVIQKNITKIEEQILSIMLEQNTLKETINNTTKKDKKRL